MKVPRIFACLVLGGLTWAFGPAQPEASLAQGGGYPNYSQWYHNTDYNYYYCNYTYGGGQDNYHRVYYYPKAHYPAYYGGRRYTYYYNWRTRRYWGRMDLETGKYSLLPEDKRKEKLTDIKESDFPEPVARATVAIPGAEKMMMKDLPPPLPKDKDLPKEKDKK
jgi:hypothetical protein